MVLSKTVKDLRQARTRLWSSITEVLPISPWRCHIRVSARDSSTLRSKTFTYQFSYCPMYIQKDRPLSLSRLLGTLIAQMRSAFA